MDIVHIDGVCFSCEWADLSHTLLYDGKKLLTFCFFCRTWNETQNLFRFNLSCVLLQMEFRGIVCRDAVNDCDIPEICSGNSSQVSTDFSS